MRIWINAWKDTAHPEAGGSELVVDTLATGLTGLGHEVTLAVPRPHATGHPYRVRSTGGFWSQYVRGPLVYLRYGRRSDLVIDVSNGVPFFTPLWRRKPTLCLVHHAHTAQWSERFPAPVAAIGRWMERSVVPRLYRSFVAISPSTCDDLVAFGICPDRIHTIPNGIELPIDDSIPKSPTPTFVAVARDVPHKRLDLLIEMFVRVREQVGGELHVVGADDQRLAAEGVTLHGRVDAKALRQVYARSWLLVHSASREGWGMVIPEAAAHGTPALGFNVAGVRDAVHGGVSGLLVDNPDEFVDAWVRLTNDGDERARLGRGARDVAVTMSWDSRLAEWDRVARSLVDTRQRGPGTVCATSVGLVSDGATPSISVVIPAYNEAERLPSTLTAVMKHLDPTTEIVVVDDGSSDSTSEVAIQMLRDWPMASVLTFERNAGKGAAVREGMLAARGAVLLTMDADLATDLDAVPETLRLLQQSDVVIGSRAVADSVVERASWQRAVSGRTFNALVRLTTGLRVRDTQCGYKAFRRDVGRRLFSLATIDGFSFDVEILAIAQRLGYSVAEVPVRWTMIAGSKVELWRDSGRMALDMVAIRRRVRSLDR